MVGGLGLAVIFGKAMVGPLFAQTAWTNVTFTGSEIRDPGRTLPRALLIGCGVVVTLYVLTNLAYVATLSLGEIAHAPQNRVGGRLDERALWRSRCERDGGRDLDLDFWLQQRPHSRRRTGLLCDGSRRAFFSSDRAHQRATCPGCGAAWRRGSGRRS